MRRTTLFMALLLSGALSRAVLAQSSDKADSSDTQFGKDIVGIRNQVLENRAKSKQEELRTVKVDPGTPGAAYMSDFGNSRIVTDAKDMTLFLFDSNSENSRYTVRSYLAAPPSEAELRYVVVLFQERELAVWDAAGLERSGLGDGAVRALLASCQGRDAKTFLGLVRRLTLINLQKDPAVAKAKARSLDCRHAYVDPDDVGSGERKGDRVDPELQNPLPVDPK